MTEHSYLAPSNMGCIVQCAGSLTLQALCPQEETEASREGTLAHEVLKAVMLDLPLPTEGVTDEMLDGAELFKESVEDWTVKAEWHVEERVSCSVVHDDCFGTPDFWQYFPELRMLKVLDYKFGHRYVEAMGNWQLITYALGIIDSHQLAVDTVVLGIVQPRCYVGKGPVRSWTISMSELAAYLPELQQACELATTPGAGTRTGNSCGFCSARHICPALQKVAHLVADMSDQAVPFDLTPAAMAAEYRMLTEASKRLQSRIDGLHDEMLVSMKRGVSMPNYHLEQSFGRLKWVRPIEEVLALGNTMGVSLSKPGVVTPSQAEKAGLPADLVAAYAEWPIGEHKLVLDNPHFARQIFRGN